MLAAGLAQVYWRGARWRHGLLSLVQLPRFREVSRQRGWKWLRWCQSLQRRQSAVGQLWRWDSGCVAPVVRLAYRSASCQAKLFAVGGVGGPQGSLRSSMGSEASARDCQTWSAILAAWSGVGYQGFYGLADFGVGSAAEE